MLNILYDNQIFNSQEYGGVSRYFSELIWRMKSDPEFNTIPDRFYAKNLYLESKGLNRFNQFNSLPTFRGKKRVENFLFKKESERIKRLLSRGEFDVFHPTYYDSSFLNFIPANKPFVITVHDMIHELYYDKHLEVLHPETIDKANLIPKADHIITISQNTKKDILHFYPGIDEKKISVIYHGNSIEPSHRKSDRLIKNKYILYVGGRKFYKNFVWMLKVIAPVLIKEKISLICAGGGSLDDYELNNIESEGLNNFVKHIEINSDLTLQNLYEYAKFLVYPSQYEGFGMPVLEAFANNCPLLISDASCFPEIANDAALYFKSLNEVDLIKKFEQLINSPELRCELIDKGNRRIKHFNWEKTLSQHKEIYRSLI